MAVILSPPTNLLLVKTEPITEIQKLASPNLPSAVYFTGVKRRARVYISLSYNLKLGGRN